MDKQSVYRDASHRFFRLFNTDFSLSDVVNLGADLLGMPIGYSDSAYHHRAASSDYPQADYDDRIRYYTETSKEELYEQMLIKTEYAQDNTPFIMRLPGMRDRWISKSFYAGCNTGHIAVPDCLDGRFDQLDREMLRIVSTGCAMGYVLLESKSRFDRVFSQEDALFESIFKEDYGLLNVFNQRMNIYSFDQYDFFCVLCVSTDSPHQLIMLNLKHYLLQLGLNGWTTVHQDKIVCLIGSMTKESIHSSFDLLSSFARKNHLFIAASDIFTQILSVRKQYFLAERQLPLIQNSPDGYCLSHENDYKSLFYIEDTLIGTPERYCHTAVHNMLEYDKDTNKEYAKTLYLYLKNGLDMQKTADALHVHKNTIQYRLTRIKELFSVDLADFNTACQLNFSFDLLISKVDKNLFDK